MKRERAHEAQAEGSANANQAQTMAPANTNSEESNEVASTRRLVVLDNNNPNGNGSQSQAQVPANPSGHVVLGNVVANENGSQSQAQAPENPVNQAQTGASEQALAEPMKDLPSQANINTNTNDVQAQVQAPNGNTHQSQTLPPVNTVINLNPMIGQAASTALSKHGGPNLFHAHMPATSQKFAYVTRPNCHANPSTAATLNPSNLPPYTLEEVPATSSQGARVYKLAQRSGFCVRKVERVHNATLELKYCHKRSMMQGGLQPSSTAKSVILASRLEAGLSPDTPPYKDNEALLFHKPRTDDLIPSILEIGLSTCYSVKGSFGRGLYFADDIGKSHKYGHGDKVLLCRVVLGDCVHVKCPGLYWDRMSAPRKPDCHKRYDGDVTFSSWYGVHERGSNKFNEYVVNCDDQIYPQYVVTYECVNPWYREIAPPSFIVGLIGGSGRWMPAVNTADGDVGKPSEVVVVDGDNDIICVQTLGPMPKRHKLAHILPPSHTVDPGTTTTTTLVPVENNPNGPAQNHPTVPATTPGEMKPIWVFLPPVAGVAGSSGSHFKTLLCPDGICKQLSDVVCTIGRGPGDDKHVVSREHAALSVDAKSGEVSLKVLSKNGMHLYGEKEKEWQFLRSGSEVLLANGAEFCLLANMTCAEQVRNSSFCVLDISPSSGELRPDKATSRPDLAAKNSGKSVAVETSTVNVVEMTEAGPSGVTTGKELSEAALTPGLEPTNMEGSNGIPVQYFTLQTSGSTCAICAEDWKEGQRCARVPCCFAAVFHDSPVCLAPLLGCQRDMDARSHHWLQCPFCKATFGSRIGDCPDGKISDETIWFHGQSWIQIKMSVRGGKSGSQSYGACDRWVFLPAGEEKDKRSEEGSAFLELIKLAFERRHCFKIDNSLTTGHFGVVWNSIPFKTRLDGGAVVHGFPDPFYLIRLKDALELCLGKEIVEATLKH